MARIKRNVWLSEQQIGDLLWEKFLNPAFEGQTNKRWFREFYIGNGRVDFLAMHDTSVNLYELKITASIDSVIQIVRYQQDLNEYLRQAFYRAGVDEKKCPKVKMCLIARYFDTKIIELCAELGISLLRVNLLSTTEFDLELEEFDPLPNVPAGAPVLTTIQEFYGV